MRALLINPWIHDFAAYDLWLKPLGLLTVASYLKQLKADVRLIDCLDKPQRSPYGHGPYDSEVIEKPSVFEAIPRKFKRYGIPKKLFEELLQKEPQPDIILVTSGMTYWYPGVFEAIELLRKRFGSTPVLLGGIYARLTPEHAKKYSGANHVYSGTGIPEIINIINRLTSKKLDISSIAEKTLFWPAYELYPKISSIALRTSSGCPYRCTYCGGHILDNEFHQFDPPFIVKTIEYFYQKHGIRNFAFYDDALLFNANQHISKILTQLIQKNIKPHFVTPNGLHARFITPPLANLLQKVGFTHLRLGFETSSLTRQCATGNKTTNAELLSAIKYLKNAGFQSKDMGVNLLMGLPRQNIEEIKETIEFASSLGIRIFLEEYSPVPHTPDYLKSGLPADADPLLTNNTFFSACQIQDYDKLQELKDLVHRLNGSIEKPMLPDYKDED